MWLHIYQHFFNLKLFCCVYTLLESNCSLSEIRVLAKDLKVENVRIRPIKQSFTKLLDFCGKVVKQYIQV